MKTFFVYIQYFLPQHLCTSVMGWLANIRVPWIKNYFIHRFIKKYKIDMSIAQEENPTHYPTFNSFFIRQLKPQLRPIANGKSDIACPVDGTIAQIGQIRKNQLIQAKQFYFDLETLLGGDTQLAKHFYDGSFATLYLAPHNYHRVHMPLSGKLEKTIHVPGKLFSVNIMTSELIPHLYSRNERLISIFSTDAGSMAVILVGALNVGNIQTVWKETPSRPTKLSIATFSNDIFLPTGAELGYFKLGSTVILLYGKDKISWHPTLTTNSAVQFGQLIGHLVEK